MGGEKKNKKTGGLSPAQLGSTSFALFQRVHFLSMPWSAGDLLWQVCGLFLLLLSRSDKKWLD